MKQKKMLRKETTEDKQGHFVMIEVLIHQNIKNYKHTLDSRTTKCIKQKLRELGEITNLLRVKDPFLHFQ
jgi:hypothetical protein